MSIVFATLALAAAPVVQGAPAAPVDHAQHSQHQQHAQHMLAMQHCHDMMLKMHQGMKHDGHGAQQVDKAGEHQGHDSRH
jgi:hypothetical protein